MDKKTIYYLYSADEIFFLLINKTGHPHGERDDSNAPHSPKLWKPGNCVMKHDTKIR